MLTSKQCHSRDEEQTVLVEMDGRTLSHSPNSPSLESKAKTDAESPDDGKTVLVGATNSLPAKGDLVEHSSGASEYLRPDPSPRLSWPARDRALVQGLEPLEMLKDPAAPTQVPQHVDLATMLCRAANTTSPDEAQSVQRRNGLDDRRVNAVVGWFVIVEGPGRGRSLEIGIGANSIGREQGQRVRIDFGDRQISRDRHAIVIFDSAARKFLLQSGGVQNPIYVADEPLLMPKELIGGEMVLLGQTKLRFVAFCGPDFGWA